MAGYTRQSTFADGDTITAALFNNEFNQLLNAFSNTSGHKHDGTANEGPVIGLIGDAGETSPNNKVLIDTTNNYIEFYVEVSSAPVQQLYISDGAIIPVTDSDIDLGTTSLRFKDTYTDTVTTTGNVSIGGDLTVTGSATISGNLTFGDADTDSINLAAEIDSDIIPNTDGTYDLGSATKEWQDLYIDGTANIDSLVADTADINGGTIDGATIATSDITVGAGKTLDVSSGTLTLADNQISGDKVEGGTIAATTVTTLTSTTGNITNVNATTLDTTNIEVTNLKAKDGTSAGSIADSTGVVTLASSVLTTTDINGGTIDGVTIGGTTAGAVTFTDLSDGTITIAGFADEDNMSSDSATLIPTQQSVKAYVDSQVTAQDLDFQGDTGGALSIDLDSESLTIAGGTGLDTVGSGNTVTVNIDSTVATLTGTQTLTNKTLTSPDVNTPDIDGGTIDGTVIGGATPAAGTFTTLTANTSITGTLATAAQPNITSLGTLTTLTVDDITINGSTISDAGILTITTGDDFSVDAEGDISLDANGGDIRFKDNGTVIGQFTQDASNFVIKSAVSDEDLIFRGNDGGSEITALTLDMSDAGKAIFNAGANFGSGIDVTGTVTADGLTVDGDATISDTTPSLLLMESDTTDVNTRLLNNGGDFFLSTINDAKSSVTNRLSLDHATGDISFYEDTGTSQALYWDASAESLGIGTTSPAQALDVVGAIKVSDGILNAGAGGSASVFNEDGTTADFRVESSGNTHMLFVDGGLNRVGIGTTSPSQTLHVSSSGATSNGIRISNSEGSFEARVDGGEFYLYDVDDTRIPFLIDTSGNVGIGTTSPSQKLDVDSGHIAVDAGYGLVWSGDADRIITPEDNSIGGLFKVASAAATRFMRGSNESMRIDSSGNVGIGTTSPSANLHVSSASGDCTVLIEAAENASGSEPRLQLKGTNTSSNPIIEFGDSAAFPGSIEYENSDNSMRLGTNGSEKMRIDSSGNVGIGTTSGDVFSRGYAKSVSISSTGISKLQINSATGQYAGIDFGINGTRTADINSSTSSLNLNTIGAIPITFITNGSERMRIDSSGYLLLGTSTTPSSDDTKLVVSSGTGAFTQYSYNGGAGCAVGSPATAECGIFTYTGNIGSETYTERMRINSSGNVGIGTTSPASKLHIFDGGSSVNNTITFGNPSATPKAEIKHTASGNEFLNISCKGTTSGFGNIAFYTGATPDERMRIDSSGNVGIGASSISDKLEVVTAGSSSTENALRLTNPFGFSGSGNGVALIFAQDRSDAEDFPMAKIQSYQSNLNSSNEGDLDIYTSSGGSLGVRASFLSGGGIAFNGDRSQSNALDDYEEGTWTPTVASGTGAFNTTPEGVYVKVGNIVHVKAVFQVSTNFSSNAISGLPFTVADDITASVFGWNGTVVCETTGINCTASESSTDIFFFNEGDSGSNHNPNTTGLLYRVSVTYKST